MKKIILSAFVLLAAGCTVIEYPEAEGIQIISTGTAASENAENNDNENDGIISSPLSVNENKTKNFYIEKEKVSLKQQFEEIDYARSYKGLFGYEGDGYVQLDDGESLNFTVDVPVSQHYRIGLCACTHNVTAVISIGGVDVGAISIKDAFSFERFSLDGVYLEAGQNEITVTALNGIVYLDYYTLFDTITPLDARYDVSRLPANRNAGNKTIELLNFLGDTFGSKILTAQHCTPNSDAELNAVYAVTGRYPAIRAGDLGKYSRNYTGVDKEQNRELELAEAWAKMGGIVSFSWTWYEPVTTNDVSRFYSTQTTFKLNAAFTVKDLSMLDREQLEDYAESGEISNECLNLILDIDDMAENLKQLRDKDIPVLWRPLMEAGTGWYWWGDCQSDSFIWLWRLMFDRMSNYHGLNNLIWVWNGADYDFYPGDEYVDIIGEDVYNMSDTSNLPLFNAASRYTISRRITAMTECGLIPDPDLLKRDNAMWLWFGLFKGDYLIADNGLYFSEINTKKRLNHAYNHELTVTLDELPKFG